jgi:membrane-associated phospholipid phosphatase
MLGSRVIHFEQQTRLSVWCAKNFTCMRGVNTLLHFADKPPVVVCIKAILFSNPYAVDTLTMIFLILICNICKTIANGLKDTLRVPRPNWVSSELHPVEKHEGISERSFSLPSCHTVFISSVTLLNALYFEDRLWAWMLYVCLSTSMAISRVALRMHWPLDTFCALVLTGTLCPVLYAGKAYALSVLITPIAVITSVSVYVVALTCVYAFLLMMLKCEKEPVGGPNDEGQNVTTFKRAQLGTELRDNAYLLGMGVGAYVIWSIPNGLDFGIYPTGINSMCRAVAGCVVIINYQNIIRFNLYLNPWSTPDYAVKILCYFLCGILTMTVQLPQWGQYSQVFIISSLVLQSVIFARRKPLSGNNPVHSLVQPSMTAGVNRSAIPDATLPKEIQATYD